MVNLVLIVVAVVLLLVLVLIIIIITSHNRAPRDCGSARRQTGRQRQTTECVLPLTYVDLFRSLRTALTLIKTMQPRGAYTTTENSTGQRQSYYSKPSAFCRSTRVDTTYN